MTEITDQTECESAKHGALLVPQKDKLFAEKMHNIQSPSQGRHQYIHKKIFGTYIISFNGKLCEWHTVARLDCE